MYDKDPSGDPESPINERIQGLFFMASVELRTDGEPMRRSQFGSTRLLVPVDVLVQIAGNLYFADFYCMLSKQHYVTLVLAMPGSVSDRYCEVHLPKMDIAQNPFFDLVSNSYRVGAKKLLSVKILFTENIDVRTLVANCGAEIRHNIPIIGKGSSTKGGRPKNPECTLCNI